MKIRTVIESKEVQQEVDDAIKRYKRMGDVFEAVKWRLSREPEKGLPIPETNPCLYLAKTPNYPREEIPTITVVYSYDDKEVCILQMKVESA